MKRLRDQFLYFFFEFGSLIVFIALNGWLGVKAAIAGTIAFVVLDGARRLWWRVPFTRINVLASTLAVIFGGIDLLAASPFMLKYEAPITNLATGIAFVAGARGAKPLLQEIAERRQAEPFPDRADVRRFFQFFTLAWAVYFFIKVAVYLWIGATLKFEDAIAVRSIFGSVSMGLMLAVSITQGRRLFFLCRWLGLLPVVEEERVVAGR